MVTVKPKRRLTHYVHGPLAHMERPMFQHKKTGEKVTLLSQDETSRVTYEQNGHKHHLPSHQFFADYAEATPETDLADGDRVL